MTQKEAFTILKTGANVFLTGAAGSGKTYLLNEYIRFLKSRGIGVGVTASTGIAATHMGGLTIHSWAGIGIARAASDIEIRMMAANKRVLRRFTRTDVLIIDEISMLDANRLDLVDRVARLARGNFKPFGGMQVVLSGDFFQLPPIAKVGEPAPRFAYHSTVWKNMNINVCYLHEQYRQGDRAFLEVLNAIRSAAINEGIVSRLRARYSAVPVQKRITKLYSHNVNVDAENSRELARLRDTERHYRMEMRGVPAIVEALKKGCLAPEVLTLKKGAAVIFVKNNFEKRYVNGTLGRVTDFDEDGFPWVTAFDGRELLAAPATWSIEENGKIVAEIIQVPLRLAWAITIHKSQGMTLDAAEIDLSDAFERGMGYVALSRVRSLAGIKLLGFNEIALQVSPEIISFDRELRKRSEETAREFHNVPEDAGERYLEKYQKTYSVTEMRKSHHAAYQKWFPEEEKRLIADFKAGVSIKALALKLGRKYGAIQSRLRKLGFLKESM